LYRRTYIDASGRRVKCGAWTAGVKIGDAVRRLPAFSDKRASAEYARRVEQLAALKAAGEAPGAELVRWLESLPTKHRDALARCGLLSGTAAAARKRLADHAADYRQALLDGGATADHARLTHNRIMAVADGCGAVHLSGVRAAAVQRYLAERRQAGLSIASSNHLLRAFKSFCAWLVRERRIGENPVRHLSKLNEATDRRHVRRTLDAEELRRLLAAAEAGPQRYGMSGRARAVLYTLAVETGLRASELRSLTAASFDFGHEPTVTVAAAYSKRRRDDVLPLRRWTADLLAAFTDGRLPTAPVFRMPDKSRIADMLRADLAAAGIPYATDSGVFDFHGFRHQFITNLAAGGVHPKDAQTLARHSTITLTMDRYTHTSRGQLAAALHALPDLATRPAASAKATGTDGRITGAPTGLNAVRKRAQSCAGKRADGARAGGGEVAFSAGKSGDFCASRRTELTWAEADLNRRHTDFQSVALPTELPALWAAGPRLGRGGARPSDSMPPA